MRLDVEILKKMVNTPSPSGYEYQLGGQKVWMDYVSQYADRVEIDEYGNAYAFYGSTTHYPDENGVEGVLMAGEDIETSMIKKDQKVRLLIEKNYVTKIYDKDDTERSHKWQGQDREKKY